MISFYRMWPERGLIWRAGLICALMKSISPSAIILGPMMGILSEAILLDLFIRLLGKSLPGLMVAGGISVMAAFGQKIFNILVIYGFSLVRVYLNLFDFAARQMGFESANPLVLILVLAGIYFIMGVVSAIAGFLIGNRTASLQHPSGMQKLNRNNELFSDGVGKNYSTMLLFLNLFSIPAGIILINNASPFVSTAVVSVYILFCLYRYPGLWRRLKKPFLWTQFLIIIVLSVLFWQSDEVKKGSFDYRGMAAGLEMSLRALMVISGFTGISYELRSPLVRMFLFKRGLRQVYSSVSMAFQALPSMLEHAVKPRELVRRPFQAVAMMLSSAAAWEKTFESTQQKTN